MKTIKLPFNKVSNPATYDLLKQLYGTGNVTWNVSRSQLLKRLDTGTALELLELAEAGEEIKIVD